MVRCSSPTTAPTDSACKVSGHLLERPLEGHLLHDSPRFDCFEVEKCQRSHWVVLAVWLEIALTFDLSETVLNGGP